MYQLIHQQVLTLSQYFLNKNYTLATAESCTGGGIAYHLTDLPGSSQWFKGGIVAYNNQLKQSLLGVDQLCLETYGAVSQQAARAMAEGARINCQADFSLAVTGIAGPGGGSQDKPVGTVWFAWTGKNLCTQSAIQHFSGDRLSIREQTIYWALAGLLERVGSK